MADERYFELEIITPDRVFYKDRVLMVEFNTTEGEIGIYRNHIPLTVILKPGVLTITGEEKKQAALHAGFATILQDKITIMAETVEWPEEIDLKRAHAARERAEVRLREGRGDTDIARAETALQRAMARINTIK
ncbi:MAG: ATP synthase F1 subunit epsilon [Lachnospiraceae bacterium]